MSEETKKIDVGGYSLRARTVPGNGPETFVLLHGYADGLEVWNEITPSLAARGTVVLIELRGHGYSSGPAGPYAWDDLAGDIVKVTDELGVQKATFIGHGLGGIIALLTALAAPDRVERLVLLGTATEATAEQENWCREIVKAGRMNALQGISHAIFGPISRKQVDGIAGPMIELAELMETLHATPITDRMAGITCPALVLVGENDPARAKPLAEVLPNGSLVTLPGLAHFPHKKEPAAVTVALETFLAG